jgi:hypothetical protein
MVGGWLGQTHKTLSNQQLKGKGLGTRRTLSSNPSSGKGIKRTKVQFFWSKATNFRNTDRLWGSDVQREWWWCAHFIMGAFVTVPKPYWRRPTPSFFQCVLGRLEKGSSWRGHSPFLCNLGCAAQEPWLCRNSSQSGSEEGSCGGGSLVSFRTWVDSDMKPSRRCGDRSSLWPQRSWAHTSPVSPAGRPHWARHTPSSFWVSLQWACSKHTAHTEGITTMKPPCTINACQVF